MIIHSFLCSVPPHSGDLETEKARYSLLEDTTSSLRGEWFTVSLYCGVLWTVVYCTVLWVSWEMNV